MVKKKYIMFFSRIGKKDVSLVGGKTASLGELTKIGMPVPNGFAITADAYRYFIKKNKLNGKIKKILKSANIRKIEELRGAGAEIRSLIRSAEFPKDLEKKILSAFKKLNYGFVAVRSSATAEDLPDASFAGQQESFLNVAGKDLLDKVRDCFASLFTNRAISYREDKNFNHFKIALSVAVQKQVFSKSSGVLFTIDPDSGHRNFVVINSSYGLGDYIVQGRVTPDEFWVFKQKCRVVDKVLGKKHIMEVVSVAGVKKRKVPKRLQKKFSISDEDAEQLARFAVKIEKHYKRAMDIEWAKTDRLYILQARPETVHSVEKAGLEEYLLKEKGKVLLEGSAIGRKISSGSVNVIRDAKEIHRFEKGQILVTKRTDPDWEPIMKIAKGIVTEEGGRTSHAAIVSRELGVPAVIGVPNATNKLKTGDKITLDCSKGKGKIRKGILGYKKIVRRVQAKKTKTKVFVNVGMPEEAIDASLLPVDGVGLAREEFIITASIGVHPLELIKEKKENEFIEKLASGIGKIAAAFYPRPVIVRLSDFKTNEYCSLKGGKNYEPVEENPMIGWRGAYRYISKQFEPAFRLECKAFKRVIDDFGLDNVNIMIPFCRTVEEAKRVLKIIKKEKIKTGIYVMAEIPSNIILADKFSKLFAGFSIGSNDLTQLVLGVGRDNEMLAKEFDERNEAVKRMIKQLIKVAHKYKRKVGICGDAPGTFPDFTRFLVKCGIDSISVTPDVAVQTKLLVAKAEKK